MSDKPSPLEQFTAAVELAMALPTPRLIGRAIVTGTRDVDDGLRAASYDGDRVTGGTSTSHVERMVARRNPDQFPRDDDHKDDPDPNVKPPRSPRTPGDGNRASDDLYRLSKASERAVDAIAALAALCRDAPPPDTWEEALWHTAVLLGERCDHPGHEPGDHPLGSDNPHDCQTLDTITPAVDVDRNTNRWIERFSAAVETIRAIRDSWMAHAPQSGLGLIEREGQCRSHERIGIHRPRVSRLLCQQCWRDVHDLEPLGPPVDLQRDPAKWPTEAMLRAREDGRRVLFDRERLAWLRGHGIDVQEAHRRRQERRSA